MKLLMLISELGYGGAEGAFLRLAQALAQTHEVEIALFERRYPANDYTVIDPAVGLPLHLLDDARRTGRLRRWRRRSERLRALKEKLGTDAVISFLSGPNLLNAVTSGPGLKLVSIRGSRIYGNHMRRAPRALYRHALDPLTHALADGVVACSTGLLHEVSHSTPRRPPPSRFRAIAGYVDSEELIASAHEPLEPGWERLRGEPLICGIGRLTEDKGFQHLIALLPEVRQQIPDARLVIVGDGPYWSALKQICAARGLRWSEDPASAAEVLFAGYQPRPHRFAGLSGVHVLASGSEGLPNVLVEALASGVTVMAGDIPWGVRDVFGIAPDCDNRPYSQIEPLDTGVGWLMPRIDRAEHREAWVTTIAAALRNRGPDEARMARAHERVRALDIRHAAARWNGLIAELQAAER